MGFSRMIKNNEVHKIRRFKDLRVNRKIKFEIESDIFVTLINFKCPFKILIINKISSTKNLKLDLTDARSIIPNFVNRTNSKTP